LLVELSRYGSDAVPRLADELGVPVGGRISVVVAETDEEFHALQPGRTPEWADATAWPEAGVIYLRSPRARGASAKPLETVFDHEIIHVLLGQAFAPHRTPRWLQEGMAQEYAGEGSAGTLALATGVLYDDLLTLEDLHRGFPRQPEQARLAYAQSAHFVGFIRSEYGEEAMQEIVRTLARGASIDAAVYAGTGLPLHELDQQWRADLASGPLWVLPLTAEEGIGVAMGVLAVLALIRQRRRTRARLRGMADEEAAFEAMIARARSAESLEFGPIVSYTVPPALPRG
jgi:hypothetical protein